MACKFRYKGADLVGSLIPRPPLLTIGLRKGRSRLRWVSQLMKQGWREWDEQVLKRCMYPHDVEEVLKICLTDWREGKRTALLGFMGDPVYLQSEVHINWHSGWTKLIGSRKEVARGRWQSVVV
jgi:hypothetical protein